jgi:cytoskeletal protein CcmA (bactofilin family)
MMAGLSLKKKLTEQNKLQTNAIIIEENFARTPIVIPEHSFIKGCLSVLSSIRIEGYLEGTLYSKENIIIDDSAEVIGNIIAGGVTVSGKITGNIYCLGKVLIKNGGSVEGKIFSMMFQNEEGSNLSSSVSILNIESIENLRAINDQLNYKSDIVNADIYHRLIEAFNPSNTKNSK